MPGRNAMSWAIVIVAACAGMVGAGAPAGGGQWPIAPVPANAYSVVRPNQNPLVKPDAKVPAPTIVWEKIKVRPDHPRLVFNKDTKEAFAKRLVGHPATKVLRDNVKQGDPVACAFMWQMAGNRAHADTAIKALLDGKLRHWARLYVFDWTYDAMTEAQRAEAIEQLWATVMLDRASGWPRCSPFTGFPDDPRPSETAPARWAPFYNWTFHDQDWARSQATSFVALVVLAGHRPRAEEAVRNYWEYSLKDAALFFDYLHDGSYWQGYYWSITAKVSMIVDLFDVMRTACNVDYLDPAKHPYLGNISRWLLYCCDPWRKQTMFAYGDGGGPVVENRAYRSIRASNSLVHDPYVEWFLNTMFTHSLDWLDELRYHDYNVRPIAPTKLPPSRAFPGTGLATMRSGWHANAVWASVRWADWFGIHCHNDVGSFILYCKSPLVPDTGYYSAAYHAGNYYRRSIAHNTFTIRDPKARLPINDGDQRGAEKRTWSFAVGTAAWVYNQESTDRGDLTAFETHKLYDYCAGDGTMAYSRDMVKEFNRQTVFLRDGVFLVFDRVETTRPDLEKRWLMHLVGEPRINGKLRKAHVRGHIEDYDGSLTISRGRLGATIRCHTLLPAKRILRRVGGPIPNIPVSTIVRVPRTRHRMGTGSRWAWSDPLLLYYNDPLTKKKVPFLCIARDSPTLAEYEVTDSEFYLKLDAYERGRVDEVRVKLSDCKTLLDLVAEVGKHQFWHVRTHYLPGYEYYNQGMNYSPAYNRGGWTNMREEAPELLGAPNDKGAWRIEVYPDKPATRDYFLNVIRVQPTDDAPAGDVHMDDSPDRAEARVVLRGKTYSITFAKKGPVGGHIRITDTAGKVLANRDFGRKIVQKEWPTK